MYLKIWQNKDLIIQKKPGKLSAFFIITINLHIKPKNSFLKLNFEL